MKLSDYSQASCVSPVKPQTQLTQVSAPKVSASKARESKDNIVSYNIRRISLIMDYFY